MSDKTIFPPLSDFPAVDREDLRILLEAAPGIVASYNKYNGLEEKCTVADVPFHFVAMVECILKYMPHHENNIFHKAVVPWLFQCRSFWKKPYYVQKLEREKIELIKELDNYREYIAWQKQHLQSDKFKTDTTIQVADLLHAMEQHNV